MPPSGDSDAPAAAPLTPLPQRTPALRVLGEGGMVFDAQDAAQFARQRGQHPVDHAAVARAVSHLHAQQRTLQRSGATLVVAGVPAKVRVYPERLPSALALDAAQTPVVMLVKTLVLTETVPAVDLGGVLRAARGEGKTFLRSRPEMTWLGAVTAAAAIAALCPGAPDPDDRSAEQLGDVVTLPAASGPADVWLGGRFVPVTLETGLACVPESDVQLDPAGLHAQEVEPGRFTCSRGMAREAIVVGAPDASGGRLERMLAEHFVATTIRRAGPRTPVDAGDGTVVIQLLDDDAVLDLMGS